jgi:hypothetical protein
MVQTDRKNLVRPDGSIVASVARYVVEACLLLVPEGARKVLLEFVCQSSA